MTSAHNDSSSLSDQDTNQFLVYIRIEFQISYTTIRNFTSWANWDLQIYTFITHNSWHVVAKVMNNYAIGRL